MIWIWIHNSIVSVKWLVASLVTTSRYFRVVNVSMDKSHFILWNLYNIVRCNVFLTRCIKLVLAIFQNLKRSIEEKFATNNPLEALHGMYISEHFP